MRGSVSRFWGCAVGGVRSLGARPTAPRTTKRCLATQNHKVLTEQTVNPNLVRLEYAIRGPLAQRALEIEKELERGVKKPFKRVIMANTGDAHALGQKPITFLRQVLACVVYPELIEKGNFPEDVRARAKVILENCGGGSVSAYSDSHGIELIRRHVAEYVERRDGHASNWRDVVLSNGASAAIKNVLQLFSNHVNGKPTGVMVPIPQYPLYSATIVEYGLDMVGYYLDEDKDWELDTAELERSLSEASKTSAVRALVVINPGNPTGKVLSRQNMEDIIRFAHKHKLCLLADEMYEHNIYVEGVKFHSFKKILRDLGPPYSDGVELASFTSVSKGYTGECGIRGGWMELCNFDPVVQAHLYKVISSILCPSAVGQVAVDCVVQHPFEGEPSYPLWLKEKTAVLGALKERAQMVTEAFNSMPGFSCKTLEGALYAFPKLELPPKAIEAAKKIGQEPDDYYCSRLLEETGICVVPGSGFGQKEGTYHFRTTILPQTELLKEMLAIFRAFHDNFTREFS